MAMAPTMLEQCHHGKSERGATSSGSVLDASSTASAASLMPESVCHGLAVHGPLCVKSAGAGALNMHGAPDYCSGAWSSSTRLS